MKLLLFSGSHGRHVFVHKALIERFEVVGVVSMKREDVLPQPSPDWEVHDRELFTRHFQGRYEAERQAYGDLSPSCYHACVPTLAVDPEHLNAPEVAEFARKSQADLCFIFGVDLIKSPVIEALPGWRLNLHLGLSPWYRGSATLFWPFYFLQPQFAGSTLHQIVPEADAGQIVHQSLPQLVRGQGVHDVAVSVVKQSLQDLVVLLDAFARQQNLPLTRQQSRGKLFLSRDFEPHHLRVIYDLYADKIVDAWLDGKLGQRRPKIVDGWQKIPRSIA